MDPLHATIEEFAADGYSHVQCYCPRCRAMRLRPISWLPRISLGLTIAALSTAALCRVRWAGSLAQALAIGGCVGEASWAARVTKVGMAARFGGRLPVKFARGQR
jgi:hypothetical protein